MWPVLLAVGPIRVETIIAFLVAAFFVGLFAVFKMGKEAHWEDEEILDLALKTIGVALVAGRVGFVFNHWSSLGLNIWLWLNFWGRPGFEFWAMVAGGLGYLFYLSRQEKRDFWQLLDLAAPGAAGFIGIMALGDFFNGSNYGVQTQSFLGLQFAGLYDRRLPIQLFESVWFLGLLFGLYWSENHYRTFGWYRGSKSEANSGFLGMMGAIFGGLGMLIANSFRPERLVIWNFRLDTILPLAMLVWGIWSLHRRSANGLVVVIRKWFYDRGVVGGLIERWQNDRGGKKQKLELGKDIF